MKTIVCFQLLTDLTPIKDGLIYMAVICSLDNIDHEAVIILNNHKNTYLIIITYNNNDNIK